MPTYVPSVSVQEFASVQVSIRYCLIAIIALIAPSMASAEIIVYDQLNGFGQTALFSGASSTISQYDTTPGLTAPFLPELATTYDNFTLAKSGQLDQLQWTGVYGSELGAALHASAFRIAFYQDNSGGVGIQQVGTQIGSTIIAPIAAVNETSKGGTGFRFQYTYTPTSSLVFTAGTKYWMSITAALDWGDDGIATATSNRWGWEFNDTSLVGDANSFQTIQDGALVGSFYEYSNNQDPIDHSFQLTTTVVPEPSSCLLLASAASAIWIRRRCQKRKSIAAKQE